VSAQSGDSLLAFALGAGLKPDDLAGIDETVLFEQVGKMMREYTDGMIKALRGRYEVKSEFHMQHTMMGPRENNPLKFQTSTSGALVQLVTKKDPAYKSGAEAVSESHDDMNAHQLAVIAGMEAAIQGILKRFNPKTLENRMKTDSVLDNILPGGRKAKYWEVFKLLFDDIANEVEDDSEKLFGKEFSRAYEEQLARLKIKRKE
jgi:type VI secretion system protein